MKIDRSQKFQYLIELLLQFRVSIELIKATSLFEPIRRFSSNKLLIPCPSGFFFLKSRWENEGKTKKEQEEVIGMNPISVKEVQVLCPKTPPNVKGILFFSGQLMAVTLPHRPHFESKFLLRSFLSHDRS